jgi:hypothetical protein
LICDCARASVALWVIGARIGLAHAPPLLVSPGGQLTDAAVAGPVIHAEAARTAAKSKMRALLQVEAVMVVLPSSIAAA